MIALLLSIGAGLQAPPSQARLHPPESVVYLEVPDVAGLLEAYGEAPMVQMIRSEEVQASMGDLLDSVEMDLDQMAQSIADQIGVPIEMVLHPATTFTSYTERVSGASLSVSLLEDDAGSLAEVISDIAAVSTRLTDLTDQLFLFAAEHDELFPATLADLEEGIETTDPWGHPFQYGVDPDGTGFSLSSLGRDGAPGGEGVDTDFEAGTKVDSLLLLELKSRVGATAVLSFHEEDPAIEAHELLVGLASKGGLPTRRNDFAPPEGVDVSWFSIPGVPDMPLWTLRSGGHLVIGFGSSHPEALLKRLGGEGTGAADAASYTAMAGRFSESPGVPVVQGYFSLTDLGESLGDVAKLLGDGPGDMPLITPYLESKWRMGLAGDRFVMESHASPPNEDNLLARCLGSRPVPEEIWRFVPADSIAVYATTFEPRLLYDFVINTIGSNPDAAHVHNLLANLEGQHGFSFKEDIFGSLGHGGAGYLLPIGGLMSVPGMALVLQLEDAEAFQRGLEGLLTALGEQSGGDFEIRYKPYRDAPLWYFSFKGDSPIPISPSLAIVEDHLLVTLTSVRAKKEIKRLLASAEETPELHPVLSGENAPPKDAVGVGYLDWGSLFEGVYEGGRAVLGFMGGGANLPFDVTALPEAATFSQFYEPSVLWKTSDEDGMYSRVESSFGPETLIGLGTLGAGAFLGVQAYQSMSAEFEETVELEMGEAPEEPGMPPEATTRDSMRFLSTRLAVFKLDTGGYPKQLALLAEGTANYPNGFLDGGEVPSDGWGNTFAYAASADLRTYRLWSLGPDGVDQNGEGDDLVAE